MSKFRFIFSRGSCELASYEASSGAAEMLFPRGTYGEVAVGEASYPLSSGKAQVKLAGFADGIYRPTLKYGDKEYSLPKLKKEGNVISFVGYSTEELCERFDELRRTRTALRELTEKYKQLEEYVFGKGLF